MTDTKITAFIDQCLLTVGIGFHPDTDARDYVNDEGWKLLGDTDADRMNATLDEACLLYDGDIYELTIERAKALGLMPDGIGAEYEKEVVP